MKKKLVRYIILGLLMLVVLVSCSSIQTLPEVLSGQAVGCVLQFDNLRMNFGVLQSEKEQPTILQSELTTTCPTWSSAYDRFAYSENGDIHIYSFTLNTEYIAETSFFRLSNPVWSPNDERLAFAAQMESFESLGLDIWTMDLPTYTWQRLVTCATASSSSISCDSPSWLSNSQIAYIRHDGIDAIIEIYDLVSGQSESISGALKIRRDTGQFGNCTSLSSFIESGTRMNLSSSPDGTKLAFVMDEGRGINPGIFLLEVASGNITALTPPDVWAESPTWANNEYLIFVSTTWGQDSEILHPHDRSNKSQNLGLIHVNSRRITWLTHFKAPDDLSINCPFVVPESIGERILTTK